MSPLIPPPGPGDRRPAPGPDGRALRILVAEDNPTNQFLIGEFLKRRGYTTVMVASGAAAVEAVRREAFDLVLMDVQMPGMDGLAATRRIRAPDFPRREIPIIALTAFAMENDRSASLAAGMNDFVTKPIEAGALYSAIARAVTDGGAPS